MTKKEKQGMMMPVLKYQFRVIFGHAIFYKDQACITRNIEKCSIDMKNKTFDVTIRQSVELSMINVVNFIVKNTLPIYVEPLASSSNPYCSIELVSSECIEHKLDFDYGDSDPAKHIIKFKYSHIREILPIDWESEVAKLESS